MLLVLSILKSISGFHTARYSNARSISGFYTARYRWLEYWSILLECLSILGFNALGTRSTPSIFYVCTAGTARTRAYILLILPVLVVFRPSVLLILQLRVLLVPEHIYCSYFQYSQYLGHQYCSYSKYSRVFRPPVL